MCKMDLALTENIHDLNSVMFPFKQFRHITSRLYFKASKDTHLWKPILNNMT
jgi:hypothetical protein